MSIGPDAGLDLAYRSIDMTVQADDKPDLAELLARLDELRQAERRAVSARMVSVAGHLIGTPLNVIAGRAALIRTNPTPDGIEENVRRIEEQVERLALRIRRLIDYFSLVEPRAKPGSVGDVLEECRRLYGPVSEHLGVGLSFSAQGVEPCRVESSLASLVLTTLIALGVRTTAAGQSIEVRATEHGPRTVRFELLLPGLEAPPKNFERLDPPEHGQRYDAGALETLWTCLGLARRAGGSLDVVKAESGAGVTIRFECAHG
jgi:signal transduction histidine kinase